MKIRDKVVFSVLLIVFLVGTSIFLIVNHYSERELEKQIEDKAFLLSQNIIENIDQDFSFRLRLLQDFVSDLEIIKLIKESNNDFQNFGPEEEILSIILEREEKWTSLEGEEKEELVQTLIDELISKKLKERKDFYESQNKEFVFSEVFVSNKYGVVIGQTNTISDYYQADEEWWKEAKAKDLYVGEIEYDESIGLNAIDFAIKIEDRGGNFLGVLKAVFPVKKGFDFSEVILLLEKFGIEKEARERTIEVAEEVDTYLKIHSDKNLEDLKKDPFFQKIVVQEVGEKGYTALYDNQSLICRFHKKEEFIDLDFNKLKETLPEFWNIISKTKNGRSAEGFYEWQEPEGVISEKYMYSAPLNFQTADGINFNIAATMYIDDFKKMSNIPIITLLNSDKKIVYSSEDYNFLEKASSDDFLGLDAVDFKKGKFFSSDSNNQEDKIFFYTYSQGYKDFEGLKWILALEYNKEDIFVPIRDLSSIIMMTVFIIMVLAFGANYALAQSITNPIIGLGKDMEIIGKGDLNHKIRIQADEEINSLVRNLNKMVSEFNSLKNKLDQKVKEQTKEIKKKASHLLVQKNNLSKSLEDVRKERDKIKIILESIGEGVFVINSDLKIIAFNRAARRISGYLEKEVIGNKYSNFLKFISEKKYKITNKLIKDAFEEGKVQKDYDDLLLVAKNNQKIPVAITAAPLEDKNGSIIGCVVVFRNVFEEREIDKAKTEFVSLASHQLRAPLSIIKWCAGFLLNDKKEDLTEDQKEYLEKIYEGNERMINLVKSLLNLSRIELGELSIKPKKINVRDVMDKTIEMFDLDIKEKELNVIKDYKDVPEVVADEELLSMVFGNLISNAVKYSNEKGEVKIKIYKKDKNIEISVSDNGIGIPKNQHKFIFKKLFRSDNVKTKNISGVGLGLYIVKSIVEAYGGNIWFESKLNEGSTFYLSIPLKGMKEKEGGKKLE